MISLVIEEISHETQTNNLTLSHNVWQSSVWIPPFYFLPQYFKQEGAHLI